MFKKHGLFTTLALVALAALLALSLAGCKGSGNEEPVDTGDEPVAGGTMSFYIGEPAYIDPYNAQESEGMQVTQVLFDSLTAVDPMDATVVNPAAATEWSANADASVWTFKLNPDGVFSDGNPVTAADFIYAWNRIANPNTKNTLTGEVDASIIAYHIGVVKGFDDVQSGKATEMSGLKAIDDYTLEVTLSQPFADFPYVTAHPALCPVEKALVEGGVDNNGTTVPFGDMPVGNGPFKMAEPWVHDQYIKVVKNEAYVTGDQPYLDGVEFKIFKDPETAFTEFEAGNLDFTSIGEGKIQDSIAKYGESVDGYTVNEGTQVVLGDESAIYYLIFNMDDKVMKQAKVREASSLAINRQAICDVVFEGTRNPADNFIPPGIAGYESGAWALAKYDVEAAKKALADAGYPEGKGLPTIKLSFNSGGGHEPIFELIQADLAKVGIKTEFDSADFPTYLAGLDAGKHQLARLGWIADYPIAYNFMYPMYYSKSGDNKANYNNATVDADIMKAETIVDDTARAAEFARINKVVAAELPYTPLLFYKHTRVGSARLHDFVYDAMGMGNFSKVWLSE